MFSREVVCRRFPSTMELVCINQRVELKSNLELYWNLKQQMKYANRLNSKYTILIGEDELKNEEVTIKDMNDNKQKKVKILNLDKYFN